MENKTQQYIMNDICSRSETFPNIPAHLISRKPYFDLFEDQFDAHKILCLPGENGVGLTTALAEFSKSHSLNTVSYFIDGFSRLAMEPRMIEESIKNQLAAFNNLPIPDDRTTDLSFHIIKAKKTSRVKKEYLYFVFDGFDKIPSALKDRVRQILSQLVNIENARFIFSGKVKEIEGLFDDSEKVKETNSLLKFHKDEVKDLLKKVKNEITESQLDTLYDISEGNAEKLGIIVNRLKNEVSVEDIESIYMYDNGDLYAQEWEKYELTEDNDVRIFLALVAFSEMKLSKDMILKIMKISAKKLDEILSFCQDSIGLEKDILVFNEVSFRKYVRIKLSSLKRKIELLQLESFEKSPDSSEFFSYMPSLYKQLGKNKSLVAYLTSDNVQNYIIEQQSQAALNEQCEFGFEACSDLNELVGEYFRFAINRSASREIEKNELYDSEIEALLSVGEVENAYALSQKVYLKEEQLKCLLLISMKGNIISKSLLEELKDNIISLSDSIDYEHIPQKAIEIAKLMLHIDFPRALSIIDRIAKSAKDKNQYDRLFTAISLSYNENIKNEDNVSKVDLATTKISDEEMKKMAIAMRSVLKDCTAEEIILELDKISNPESRLYFLQFWIPNHKNQDDIEIVILYVIKLVIEVSNIIIPKASLLCKYCMPLKNVSKESLAKIIKILDAVDDSVKQPTVDYVDLQLMIVEALHNFDNEDALYRLMMLYDEICQFEDKTLMLHCKAKILSKYNRLGDNKEIEECLKSYSSLKEEIIDEAKELLLDTAYHLNIVNGPIKELASKDTSFIKEIIPHINTAERRSRAYLLAAMEYIEQVDIDDFDFNYFEDLYDNIQYDRGDRTTPLLGLARRVIHHSHNLENMLSMIKRLYKKLENIEDPYIYCHILTKIYVWIKLNFENEKFADSVKKKLESKWESIEVPWVKVAAGFEIAKNLSKLESKEEARDMIARASSLKTDSILCSSSCIDTYNISINLLTHALGILIRSNICDEEEIEQFKDLLSYVSSEGECMIIWSKIALEYYMVNDRFKFYDIVNKHVSRPLDNFSKFFQKRVFYNTAPALFLHSKTLFINQLKKFDDNFRNDCIDAVGSFILSKHSNISYTYSQDIISALTYNEYQDLIDLINEATDDNLIFNYVGVICECIKENKKKLLSREHSVYLLEKLRDLVEEKLPIESGFGHDGYKVACRAVINSYLMSPIKNEYWDKVKVEIEGIHNKADQSFLYIYLSHYVNKVDKRHEFLNLGFQKAKELNSSYDKMNRFDMAINESMVSSKQRFKGLALETWKWLNDNNGGFKYAKKIIDLIHETDEDLAKEVLEQFDNDPARIKYKQKLQKHIGEKQKIGSAQKDINQVISLSIDDQKEYFNKKIENLIKGKATIKDVPTTLPVMKIIYENSITDSKDAIYYFLENLYSKNKINNAHKDLLRDIYRSLIYNLKVVLSLAAETKDRFDLIDRVIQEKYSSPNYSDIRVGEEEKGFNYLKDWFKKSKGDTLRIIDSYFTPKELDIIKEFFDINNDLRVGILTNRASNIEIEDYKMGWSKVSSDISGEISVVSVGYKDNINTGPVHDRWWVLIDTDTNRSLGLKLNSLNGLGKKDSDFVDLDEERLENANRVWMDYVVNKKRRADSHELIYDKCEIV